MREKVTEQVLAIVGIRRLPVLVQTSSTLHFSGFYMAHSAIKPLIPK